ncbi:MAG: PQQ-dependent sugar dehydrogenase [Parvibaculaceae bacterium]
MRRAALALTLALLAATSITPTGAQEAIKTEKAQIIVDRVTDKLSEPWGLAFLPDGRMIVTEKGGTLRIVSDKGEVGEPIAGVPKVDDRGQGGLLDVAPHPQFADNRFIYVSFSEPGEGGNSTAVARGKLSADEKSLEDVKVIFSQKPKLPSTKHFGSRLVFDGKGHLFITTGERSEPQFREQSQELSSHLGKVIRVNEDGSVPDDNPFVGKADALPEIWSYGHRNIQAAAINPATGALWEIEHGPKGGDEINIAEAGKNYGWPVVSHGVNYDGSPVGTGQKQAEGMVDPLYQWTPVIAPSGMIFYNGELFPDWQGNLFVGGLAATALVRLELDGDKVVHEERLLEDLGMRVRDVVQGPEGAIYLLTDESNGAILRVRTPAD